MKICSQILLAVTLALVLVLTGCNSGSLDSSTLDPTSYPVIIDGAETARNFAIQFIRLQHGMDIQVDDSAWIKNEKFAE